MASISASLASNPTRVVLSRSEVPRAGWDEVGLAFSASTLSSDLELELGLDAFLRGAALFTGVVGAYSIDFTADEGIIELLRRRNSDGRALSDALTYDSPEAALDTDALLSSGERTIVRDLRDFQLEDLATLYRLSHGANFSVPGAGKTTVTYVLHALEVERQRVEKMLVVAPLSAFGAWVEEAAEVLSPAPSVARMNGATVPRADVVLVNYQRLVGSTDALAEWMLRHRVHLVVDEAHRAKRGIRGEWGRSLGTLAPLAARRDLLTGTPAPNHPRDLVSLLDLLWPGGRASAHVPRAALARDPSIAVMSSVNRAIAPLFVRTSKDRLGLDPALIVQHPVPMGPLQQQIYDAMLRRYSGTLDLDRRDSAMFGQLGEVTMYLMQAASSPRLLRTSADPARAYRFPSLAIPAGSSLAGMVERYADHEVPAKVDVACRIVMANSDEGKKTLVWSNFPDNLLDLEQQLAGLSPAIVYGSIPSDDDAEPGVRTRERELERFKNDPACKVLLANPAALSEGVSLHHACNDAIYLDRTFNAGQYLQSLDRIHRLGLAPGIETRITLLVSTGTIDERIHRRLETKVDRLARMLDDEHLVQMSLPDDENTYGYLDDDLDLVEVLSHLSGTEIQDDINEYAE